jgi:hypothetical protein
MVRVVLTKIDKGNVTVEQNAKGSDGLYITQSHCICGLCPSSRILNKQRVQRFGNWDCFFR